MEKSYYDMEFQGIHPHNAQTTAALSWYMHYIELGDTDILSWWRDILFGRQVEEINQHCACGGRLL